MVLKTSANERPESGHQAGRQAGRSVFKQLSVRLHDSYLANKPTHEITTIVSTTWDEGAIPLFSYMGYVFNPIVGEGIFSSILVFSLKL